MVNYMCLVSFGYFLAMSVDTVYIYIHRFVGSRVPVRVDVIMSAAACVIYSNDVC